LTLVRRQRSFSGWPFPHSEEEPQPIEESAFRRDVDALRALLA
jgi:hypothetical protein